MIDYSQCISFKPNRYDIWYERQSSGIKLNSVSYDCCLWTIFYARNNNNNNYYKHVPVVDIPDWTN